MTQTEQELQERKGCFGFLFPSKASKPVESKIEPELKYLIAGLGNIGAEYENTRHNIGFSVLDKLAAERELTWKAEKHVHSCNFRFKGRAFYLIKPTTYMNLSGKAVRYWLQQLKIDQKNLLVIVDDLDLPFAKLRLRKKGSPGGHNGLKDIDEMLGNNQYSRLRFGIGDNFNKGQQVDFVLGKWTNSETKKLDEPLDLALKIILGFGTIGVDRTMNEFNKKS